MKQCENKGKLKCLAFSAAFLLRAGYTDTPNHRPEATMSESARRELKTAALNTRIKPSHRAKLKNYAEEFGYRSEADFLDSVLDAGLTEFDRQFTAAKTDVLRTTPAGVREAFTEIGRHLSDGVGTMAVSLDDLRGERGYALYVVLAALWGDVPGDVGPERKKLLALFTKTAADK